MPRLVCVRPSLVQHFRPLSLKAVTKSHCHHVTLESYGPPKISAACHTIEDTLQVLSVDESLSAAVALRSERRTASALP